MASSSGSVIHKYTENFPAGMMDTGITTTIDSPTNRKQNIKEEKHCHRDREESSFSSETDTQDTSQTRDKSTIKSSATSKTDTQDPSQTRDKSTIAWNTCIQEKNKKEALRLLESAQLPDMETLNKLCQYDAFKTTSNVAIAVCVEICAFIKSLDNAITDVWASREAIHLKEDEKFDIKFVVITEQLERKSMVDLQERIQSYYDVLPLRNCDEFSPEEKALMIHKDKKLDDEIRAKLKACLSNNASKLLQKHTYLSVIYGCPFRSRGYGKGSPEVLYTPCIVLNVHYKGYIPIDEEPFYSEYDGVEVDVREDAFILFNQTAKEKQDYLKAGCLISGEEDESGRPAGTLGGFVIHPEYGLCGLSCSHALLSPSKLKDKSKEGQIDWSLPSLPTEQSKTQINVYQPFKDVKAQDENKIGQVVKVIYRSGNAASTDMDGYGMDVALFQLSKRLPTSTDFPVVKESRDSHESRKIQIQFQSGSVAGFAWHDEKASFSKYGATTGYTVGKLSDSGISCKSTCTWTYKKEFKFILHNQVCFRKDEENESHILPYERSPESDDRLAWKGDSGSLMFRESDGNVVCVGIIEGGKTKQRLCYVTPILPVLKAIGIMEFKNFESERMVNDVKTLVTDMKEVKKEVVEINSTMKQIVEMLKTSQPDAGLKNVSK